MNSKSTILLEHHLKELKLPGFLREYGKLAARCAAEGSTRSTCSVSPNRSLSNATSAWWSGGSV